MTQKNLTEYARPCKKVNTYNSYKSPNGWLLEIVSDKDKWTKNLVGQVYLTVVGPHNHKGFHIHAVAMYYFTCLKGQIRSIIYSDRAEKREIQMGDGDYKTIKVFPGEAHCLVNDTDEDAYVLTYRYPTWTEDNPDILTISPSEINTAQTWEKIEYFRKVVKQ